MNNADLCKVWPNEPVIINVGLLGPRYAKPLGISSGTIIGRASIALREIMDEPKGQVVQMQDKRRMTEPTLVVEGRFLACPALYDSLWQMVVRCDQDCIALWYPSLEQGFLFGPHADEWGAFNLGHFVMPEKTLCSPSSQS